MNFGSKSFGNAAMMNLLRNLENQTITINGIITGRRSVGRSLAFADLNVSAFHESVEHVKVKFSRQSFLGTISSSDFDIDAGNRLDEPFPTKKSSLPYGAKIIAHVRISHSADKSIWEIIRWKIVENPKEIAERLASLELSKIMTQSFDHAGGSMVSLSTPSAKDDYILDMIEHKLNTEGKFELGEGAFSCSTYLKIRRQQFNLHSERSYHSSEREKTNEINLDLQIENSSTPRRGAITIDESGQFHGHKLEKAKRAKIFAGWVLETFFELQKSENNLCQPCATYEDENRADPHFKTANRHDNSNGRKFHVFDVAGGKGELSLQLILQQLSRLEDKISSDKSLTSRMSHCTIIDPMVRKGNARVRHSKLSKAICRIKKKNLRQPYQTDCVSGTRISEEEDDALFLEHSIRHLATHFGPKSFSTMLQKFITPGSNITALEQGLCSDKILLLGLHPDQCTEDIVDAALNHNLPFAIVPCCVYPDLFPDRFSQPQDQNDDPTARRKSPVRTYEEFLQYLMGKDEGIKMITLPFRGKNVVLYKIMVQ